MTVCASQWLQGVWSGPAGHAGSGRSAGGDRSSRRIHRERRTAACRGAAATRATGAAQRRRRGVAVRRRVPFFLTVNFSRSNARHTEERLAELCKASRSSASVRSGVARDQRTQPIFLSRKRLLLEHRLRPRRDLSGLASSLLHPIRPTIGSREISPPHPSTPIRCRSPPRRASANPSSTAPCLPPLERSTTTAVLRTIGKRSSG